MEIDIPGEKGNQHHPLLCKWLWQIDRTDTPHAQNYLLLPGKGIKIFSRCNDTLLMFRKLFSCYIGVLENKLLVKVKRLLKEVSRYSSA